MKKSQKVTGPAIQPECKKCGRYEIFKTPCPKENCIFRCEGNNPDINM